MMKNFLWKLVEVNRDSESQTATITIHVVDAADAENTTTVTKEFTPKFDRQQNSTPDSTSFVEISPIARFSA